ncbi:MAG: 2,3-bisphosphoglycerate-independent phosphoglycerate mutase [Candidatus Wolfebacteria bacterium GW2011_GWC1_43_10]|uniref:2,3-bisphosphoglycerate-independent phosphoglycerate mutase n=1 Tax=Candidatus Wolfebacteria bacterium GW2011_GWC1_43_10 TaxID=1619011 RepID=A0A0G1CBH0_9BACT|nr:MAG: 2,3-bisphosphoglycerate-independent phosphoglycerate mutase [Candidatus Wolfebacteria bacterium GW2011_GWC1_43_10]KKT23067.1 MAG: 2,3-bisphosphoglycerate-independent phosphoglycerate mutase [Parcubacteria group bacterium GW2011_GWB1_43_8b]
MKKTVVLLVLDGWGIGQENQSNPIYITSPQNIEYIKNNFPSGVLQASGIAVGLPWGEEGNSEVGHLTMGIGKILYQHYPRISLAIKDQTFLKNETITRAIEHIKKNKSRIHLVGLMGQANVHSSLEHLNALIDWLGKEKVDWCLHIFTDGRDSEPYSAWSLISTYPSQKIASVSGRYYAMDRDKHWELTERAYQAVTGKAPIIAADKIEEHIKETYKKSLNDEFVVPVTVGTSDQSVRDGDALFFFNFREDRLRQIGESFINPHFDKFPVNRFSNLFIASMTQIRDDFAVPVAFPPQIVQNSLGKIISQNGKSQLRIAETQKYAHVTFFFNGLEDKPFANEYRVLIPSKTVPRQEEDPQMMAPAITTRLIQAIEEGIFDFILVNYANPDMVAHTGNFAASCQAIKVIDEQMEKIIQVTLAKEAITIITSDHGNIERLFNPLTGEPETKHDPSPVPIYLVAKQFQGRQDPFAVKERERYTIGMLADIAPTILELMEIEKPADMSGESLLRQLLH